MQKKPGESEIRRDSVSRTGLSIEAIKRGVREHLKYSQGKIPAIATLNDKYMALACMVKDRFSTFAVAGDEKQLMKPGE